MRRLLSLFAVALVMAGVAGVAAVPARAQDPQVDISFSRELIGSLGYPEVTVTVSPDGVDAPATLAAGYYLVNLLAPAPWTAYLDIMQPPAGLDEETATELALAAGSEDLAQEGWVYLGGTNTFATDTPFSFVINFQPGEYRWAASYYMADDGAGEGTAEALPEEVMTLVPLTVTAADATPGASPAPSPVASPAAGGAPPATVTLEMTDDLRYLVSPDPVPTGPQIWEITNTGMHAAHHVVMARVPEGTTAEAIIADFDGLMAGTPPAADSPVAQFAFVGYAALQSGGQTTWVEFDLDPGTYAVVCYIIDPATGRPHFADGMVTVFAVA